MLRRGTWGGVSFPTPKHGHTACVIGVVQVRALLRGESSVRGALWQDVIIILGGWTRYITIHELNPKGTSCAPPTYVGKVLSIARESSSHHIFRVCGCREVKLIPCP